MLMTKVQTDQDLFAAGRRAVSKGQCDSLIVATDQQGERNYHQCIGSGKAHKHWCGCGQSWHGSHTDGPLRDVVRAGEGAQN
jgi:hypothetical protein